MADRHREREMGYLYIYRVVFLAIAHNFYKLRGADYKTLALVGFLVLAVIKESGMHPRVKTT